MGLGLINLTLKRPSVNCIGQYRSMLSVMADIICLWKGKKYQQSWTRNKFKLKSSYSKWSGRAGNVFPVTGQKNQDSCILSLPQASDFHFTVLNWDRKWSTSYRTLDHWGWDASNQTVHSSPSLSSCRHRVTLGRDSLAYYKMPVHWLSTLQVSTWDWRNSGFKTQCSGSNHLYHQLKLMKATDIQHYWEYWS